MNLVLYDYPFANVNGDWFHSTLGYAESGVWTALGLQTPIPRF